MLSLVNKLRSISSKIPILAKSLDTQILLGQSKRVCLAESNLELQKTHTLISDNLNLIK